MTVRITIRDGDVEQVFDVERDPISIGGEGAALEFSEAQGSDPVALIGASGGRPFIQRIATTQSIGVFLNEQLVETSGWLEANGQIRIGSLRIGFEPRADEWLLRVERIGDADESDAGGREPIEVIPYHFAEEPEAEVARGHGPFFFATGILLVAGLAAALVAFTSSIRVALTPEPDRVLVEGGASIRIGGRWLLRPGRYVVRAEKEGYEAFEKPIEVPADADPDFSFSLTPLPGRVTVTTQPVSGVSVWIDEVERGETPIETLALSRGLHRFRVTAPLHHSLEEEIEIDGLGREQTLELRLAPAWAELRVESEPSGAELTLDGQPVGVTPLELKAGEGQRTLSLSLPGYQRWSDSVLVVAEKDQALGPVKLILEPKKLSRASTPPTEASRVIAAQRKSSEDARKTSGGPHPRRLKLKDGPELLLVEGGALTLGTPRGQQGRRANERQRQAELSRPFYVAIRETTNREFHAFRPRHDSGSLSVHTLRGNKQPVVEVEWQDAAAYCNWLSIREGLPAAYVMQGDKLVAASPMTTGYRLPTEAEWSFVAQAGGEDGSTGKYPWGAGFPPREGVGNLGDRSAGALFDAHLQGFNDGFVVSAPVSRFSGNALGFYDFSGNVSEWMHDYYSASAEGGEGIDPTGPESGPKHVVRGSSFRHSSITQLRTAYRDSSQRPRDDLGFRIARYAE